MEVNDIFSMQSVTMDKVKLSEILDLLRDRVNKAYMPGSSGNVLYNSHARRC